MEFRLNITKKYLGIPVKTAGQKEQDLRLLEIFADGNKIMEFQVPVSGQEEGYSCDYLGFIHVEPYQGGEFCLAGEFPSAFFEAIEERDTAEQEMLPRPLAHFTAERGWINDPNGLVYDRGVYHLYFQYNPFNTEWQNMSWGHAVSSDLVHWQQKDTVMYPDENGTIFSGCGIRNERGAFGLPKEALLFFYTAAGYPDYPWCGNKRFTQRMAYSLDGGETFIKYPDWELETIEEENRDPKVFWHEESKSYIMALWLKGNEFALFRSPDLEHWDMVQKLNLEKAWECPDMFRLKADDGAEKWVFWSADGFYYIGTFDGYSFTVEEDRKEAYKAPLPYAAQTYSGVEDRVISVAWLRTRHEGHLYTGAMALPRELSLKKTQKGYELALSPVREFLNCLKTQALSERVSSFRWENTEAKPVYMTIVFRERQEKKAEIRLFGNLVSISPDGKMLSFAEKEYKFEESMNCINLFADNGIIEITANHDIIYLGFEVCDYRLTGSVEYDGDAADLTVSTVENI